MSLEKAECGSPSPRLAGAEGPNGERAGVRCLRSIIFHTVTSPRFNVLLQTDAEHSERMVR